MREADMLFAETLHRSLFVDDQAIMAAGAKCAFFEPVAAKAAPVIAGRMKRALELGEPLSLVRVGNGEGNAVSLVEQPTSDLIFQGFDFEFVSQNGLSIGVDEAVPFSKKVVDAIKSADIQCYRIDRFDEDAGARYYLGKSDLSPAFGIIYARALFYRQLCAEQGKWFSNAWIHFDLIDHLDALFDSASKVYVVTGRQELEGKFRKRLGSRLQRFAHVPVQGLIPPSRSHSHFALFEEMRSLIRREASAGTLMLIGAGLFGKIYCQDARSCGAVAIDMGSAFDLLAGHVTRPVHRQIDLAAVRW
jgi:glycosyltransferase GT-like protein